ncbi:CU044_5270 family protein [Nonomuraea sp. NPDC050536]|uniref:CU044_5270 family protein n=1 Tax=Nonomuraea sp. NPDC050536 TaxID=3364366 RepID=UPI0037C7E91D
MDEMEAVRTMRRDVPEITREAEALARHTLMNAMHSSEPRFRLKLGWRLAVAAALAVLIGGGLVMTRDQPDMAQVASVKELSERAARAAEYTPVPEAKSGQWLYLKERTAPPADGLGVDPDRRTEWEQWTSVDGQQSAWYQENGQLLVQGTNPGIGAKELDAEPVTPQTMLERIGAKLHPIDPKSFTSAFGDPPPSMDDQRFQAIYQLMGEQRLPARVRAALFRALPMIPGVTITRDAADAEGRRGVAFSYTGSSMRYDLILSSDDYRFLGTYGVMTQDRMYDGGSDGKVPVKAGTPLVWTALMETQLVDKPGQRP